MNDTVETALENLGSIKDGDDPRSNEIITDMVESFSQMEEQSLTDMYDSDIGINKTGEKVEYFVKDLLADSFDKDTQEDKISAHKECLSWLGSQNHPPDIMIRDGEAIEVKKSKGKHCKLELNSSTPRTHLRPEMDRVNSDCVSCEDWDEKEMVYVLASRVSGGNVGFLWVVYGRCFCDDSSVYKKISNAMEKAIEDIDDIPEGVIIDTSGNEIATVKNVGGGAGANMRNRGMWSIPHPAKRFAQYVDNYEQKLDDGQPMFVVMPTDRFEQSEDRLRANDSLTITEVGDEDSVIIEA